MARADKSPSMLYFPGGNLSVDLKKDVILHLKYTLTGDLASLYKDSKIICSISAPVLLFGIKIENFFPFAFKGADASVKLKMIKPTKSNPTIRAAVAFLFFLK
jgi:hypothetical protein